jgi:hypothetical protein
VGLIERAQRQSAYYCHDLLRRCEETNIFINNAIITASQIERDDVAQELERLRKMNPDEYCDFLKNQELFSPLTQLIDALTRLMIDSIGSRYEVKIAGVKKEGEQVDMTDVFDAYRLLGIYHRGFENRKIPNILLGEKPDRYDKIQVLEFRNCNCDIQVRFGFHGIKRKSIPFKSQWRLPFVDVGVRKVPHDFSANYPSITDDYRYY